MTADDLRRRFVYLLTTDSPHDDMRRKDWRRAVFDADNGRACWTSTDLDMVMHAFDLAVRADIDLEDGQP